MEENKVEPKETIQEESIPEKKVHYRKDVHYPKSVYLGSDSMEGYSLILMPEMDTEYRHDLAVKTISAHIFNEALKKAFELSKTKAPDWTDGIPTLSITFSPPRVGKPISDQVSIAGLPPGAASLKQGVKEGQRYKIIVVSLIWVARWVCLPKEGIEFAGNNETVPSGTETFIGNQAFDFGVPQPIRHNIINTSQIFKQEESRKKSLEAFQAEIEYQGEPIKRSVEEKLFRELTEAIRMLPGCPQGNNGGDLSITIGYPVPFSFERIDHKFQVIKDEYKIDPNSKPPKAMVVKVPYDMINYEFKGQWSWSVQRNCEE